MTSGGIDQRYAASLKANRQCSDVCVLFVSTPNQMKDRTLKYLRKTLLTTAALAIASVTATAQDFPKRPINLVVPFNTGGGTDLLIRGFAPHFAEAIGGDTYVSNMAGGSGTVGAAALSQQKPDGYQMGYWSITAATIQPQIKDIP